MMPAMLAMIRQPLRVCRPILQWIRLTLQVQGAHVTVSLHPISIPYGLVKKPDTTVAAAPITTVTRSKALAKSNEEQDIACLVEMIHRGCPHGLSLRALYQDAFPGQELMAARAYDSDKKKAGGRSVHYDFQILVRQGQENKWLRVEHKGSQVNKPIDPHQPPWTGGVQFFNGGMEKYRLCRRYAESWYATYIGSGYLSEEYKVAEPIPSCEEWIQRDARVQGDPKTAWGLALKKAVRATGKESLRHLRDVFVPEFVAGLTEEDKQEFIEDVTPILRDSLAQKDVWLQIAGTLPSPGSHQTEFHARWSPALSITSVTGVRWSSEKDITGWIESDCAHPIRFILRWGKGAGFSNLRLDLK